MGCKSPRPSHPCARSRGLHPDPARNTRRMSGFFPFFSPRPLAGPGPNPVCGPSTDSGRKSRRFSLCGARNWNITGRWGGWVVTMCLASEARGHRVQRRNPSRPGSLGRQRVMRHRGVGACGRTGGMRYAPNRGCQSMTRDSDPVDLARSDRVCRLDIQTGYCRDHARSLRPSTWRGGLRDDRRVEVLRVLEKGVIPW